MKYLIDLKMLYEVDTGIIMIHGEEESSLRLSNQGSRLLYELIINNGRILERDYLIKKVWEDHGFSGSSVSLNVAISEIRKAFRNLGRDPGLIKTVRGKGFSLAAHIEHHTIRPPVTRMAEETPAPPLPETNDKTGPNKQKNIALLLAMLLVVILMVAGCAFLFTEQKVQVFDRLDDSDIHQVGKERQCTIYLVDKNMYEPTSFYLKQLRQELLNWNIDCDSQPADVYFSQFNKSQYQNYFIGVCYAPKNTEKYSNCLSFKTLTGS
ncbi:helix-turn-helix domain-containing protein [Erwinia sp. CPCC 100877]|nr:helix-turn-helix domain-containing protein [Erwinia sp. CPCC 100877]